MLALAGSRGMSGAALLVCRAALAAGAGLVTLGVPRGLQSFMARRSMPEVMTLGLGATENLSFDSKSVVDFVEIRKISCIVLGPGLSLNPRTQDFARRILKNSSVPLVLDADGLNSFKGKAGLLIKRRASLVMTPHAGELERVFLKKIPANPLKRVELAQKLSLEYKAVLVLKGHRTLVVQGKDVYANHTGNPAMAKGGAGDVLSGMIGAFIAQGLTPWEAARWAAYFHGKAGDIAVRTKGELGLLASDIIEYLPLAFRRQS